MAEVGGDEEARDREIRSLPTEFVMLEELQAQRPPISHS